MNFDPTEEQQAVQQLARDFAQKEIEPKAKDLDRTGRWPTEIVKRLGELGLMGVAVPTEWGGAGMDAVTYALAMEEISAACASCGVIMSVNNSLYCDPVLKFGTDAQKRAYLSPCASGEKLGCFALTEPASGSDAQTMKTEAVKKDGAWILNGSKNWITCGPEADFVIVFAVTERTSKVKHTAFLLPTSYPGVSRSKPAIFL